MKGYWPTLASPCPSCRFQCQLRGSSLGEGADYWNVKFDVTRKIKEAFDEKGIEIPLPQQTVHMASA